MNDDPPTFSGQRQRSRYRIAIADDDHRVLDALRSLLGDDPLIDLRGAFSDGFELRECCRHEHLDAVVIDVAMPGGGPDLARDVVANWPETIVVVHTAHGDRPTRSAMFEAGATALIAKGRSTDIAGEVLGILGGDVSGGHTQG